MAYEVIILGHLHMPLYFLGTFTEYPFYRKCRTLSASINSLMIHHRLIASLQQIPIFAVLSYVCLQE